MIKANMTQEESILHNLDTWCYEIGSDFEEMGKQAALEFIRYITKPHILELGCGDGSSSSTFADNNISVLAIDINYNKLHAIKNSKVVTWESDMFSALKTFKNNSVENIFSHHSLEHVVNADEVLKEISRVIKVKGMFYVIVPAHDNLHSVHHVVFESPEELLPQGFKPIVMEEQTRNEPEFKCIAQKLA